MIANVLQWSGDPSEPGILPVGRVDLSGRGLAEWLSTTGAEDLDTDPAHLESIGRRIGLPDPPAAAFTRRGRPHLVTLESA